MSIGFGPIVSEMGSLGAPDRAGISAIASSALGLVVVAVIRVVLAIGSNDTSTDPR